MIQGLMKQAHIFTCTYCRIAGFSQGIFKIQDKIDTFSNYQTRKK